MYVGYDSSGGGWEDQPYYYGWDGLDTQYPVSLFVHVSSLMYTLLLKKGHFSLCISTFCDIVFSFFLFLFN